MSTRTVSGMSDVRVLAPLLASGVLSLVLIVAIALRVESGLRLERGIEARDALMGLANELRFSSDALTRWARSYTITAIPRYRLLYGELLEVRNGTRARPGGNVPLYWNRREFANAPPDESGPRIPFSALVAAAGATPDEVALLEQARMASEELARIERHVMELLDASHDATPEARSALTAQLFDADYARAKERIMRPIEGFGVAVEERTQREIGGLRATIHLRDLLLVATALLLLGAVALAWRGFRRIIGEPLGAFFTRIRGLTPAGGFTAAAEGSLSDALQTAACELEAREAEVHRLVAELRGEEQRQRLLIENAPVAIALFDTGMRYVAFSRRWIKSYGLEGRELIGHSHYEIFPDIPERWREIHRRGLGGESLSADEDRFERADGSVRFDRWEMVPWRDADGRIGGIAFMTEDVTEKVEQRRRLALWASVFESARVGLAIGDPRRNVVVDVNAHFAAILGYSREEVMGRDVASLFPADERERAFAQIRAIDASGHGTFESVHLARDGTRVPVLLDITSIPASGDADPRRVVIAMSLTERERLLTELRSKLEQLRLTTERLREARDEAFAANNVKNAILSNMSHELRTPLNHVIGFATLLQSAPIDTRSKERAKRIAEAGSTLTRLVSNLLDAVQVETGTLTIQDGEFTLTGLFDTLRHGAADALSRKGLAIEATISPGLPAHLRGDANRLAQALGELLDNAIKFSETGPVRLRAAERAAADGSPRLLIELEDHGIGITPDQQRRLFAWFLQGDDSPTRRYGGVGMGLVLAQRIVSLMGGEIGYRPTPGGGSTFWIELPLQAAADTAGADTTADPDEARAWLGAWLETARAMDMQAAMRWKERPAGVPALLGERAGIVDTAVANFDLELAAEMVADVLHG